MRDETFKEGISLVLFDARRSPTPCSSPPSGSARTWPIGIKKVDRIMWISDRFPVRLVALDGSPDILVGRALVLVGRDPGCDVRLESIRVSRHHCCLTELEGEVLVRDLGSTNGIRINGWRVRTGRLKPGDELSIAHLDFRVEVGPAHPPSPAPRPDSTATNESLAGPADAVSCQQ